MKKLVTKEELKNQAQQMIQEKYLWLTVLFEAFLLVPIMMIKDIDWYIYVFHLVMLMIGTIFSFWIVTYWWKGNQKLLLYSIILLSWGSMMEVIQGPSKTDTAGNYKMAFIYVLIYFIALIAGGLIYYKWKGFRYDRENAFFILLSMVIYGITLAVGVGPDGKSGGEARTSWRLPVVGTFLITDVLRVLYIVILVCLLCKQGRSKKQMQWRIFLSAVFTGINMLGMLALNELGSLMIILLVYIAFVVVYVEEISYSMIVIGVGLLFMGIGVFLGESSVGKVNREISREELMTVFFDSDLDKNLGYRGKAGTIEDFRAYLTEYMEKKSKEKESEDAEQYSYHASQLAGVEDGSMKAALEYLFQSEETKVDFLESAYFSMVYRYYASKSPNAGKWIRFYLPKYNKIRTRVYCWRHPGWNPQNDGSQNRQVSNALRAGKFFGKREREKSGVSHAESDMVFVAVAEIFGNVTAVLLLAIYFLIFWEGKKIALHTRQDYNSGMAFGIAYMIWIQAIFVVASNCGLFPIVGMPVPFISQGGTSKAIMMGLIGILIMTSSKQMQEISVDDMQATNHALIRFGFLVSCFLEPIHRFRVWSFGRLTDSLEQEEEREETEKSE